MPKTVPFVVALLLVVSPAAATLSAPDPGPLHIGLEMEPNGVRWMPSAPSIGLEMEPNGARWMPSTPSIGPEAEPHG